MNGFSLGGYDFVAPISVALLAYVVEGFRGHGWTSMYNVASALELGSAALLGNVATGWLPYDGLLGLGHELTSNAIAAGLYMAARVWLGYPDETLLKNFGYAFALDYAGSAIVAPVFASFSRRRMVANIDATMLQKSKPNLLVSNTTYGTGSAVPPYAYQTSGSNENYAQALGLNCRCF